MRVDRTALHHGDNVGERAESGGDIDGKWEGMYILRSAISRGIDKVESAEKGREVGTAGSVGGRRLCLDVVFDCIVLEVVSLGCDRQLAFVT